MHISGLKCIRDRGCQTSNYEEVVRICLGMEIANVNVLTLSTGELLLNNENNEHPFPYVLSFLITYDE